MAESAEPKELTELELKHAAQLEQLAELSDIPLDQVANPTRYVKIASLLHKLIMGAVVTPVDGTRLQKINEQQCLAMSGYTLQEASREKLSAIVKLSMEGVLAQEEGVLGELTASFKDMDNKRMSMSKKKMAKML